jgi:hypothetical protein
MELNNPAIDERFIALEQDSVTNTTSLAAFTKTLTEAYQTVYEEKKKQNKQHTQISELQNKHTTKIDTHE